MQYHGEWAVYTPTNAPEYTPPNTIFWRNQETMQDWYEWSRNHWNINAGKDESGVTKVIVANNRVCCVGKDATYISLPQTFACYELEAGDTVPAAGWFLHQGAFYETEQGLTVEQQRAKMPNLSPRQLWLMANDIGIAKSAVLAAIGNMPDQDLANRLMIEVTEPPKDGYTRVSPAVADLSALMGVPPAQMDYLWMWAHEQYND